jgi:hypothetical protein
MIYGDWLNALLENVARVGDEGRQTVEYLHLHRTKISFWRARSNVGAFWTLARNIRLNTRHYTRQTPPSDPYLISLVVHEVRHLQQGFITALSVYGELDAWQVGFRVYRRLVGHCPGHPAIEKLMSLPVGWDRDALRLAVRLMRAYAGKGYRVDLLPLYPLHHELAWHFWRKMPG